MQNTDNFNLKIYEGEDLFNPLVVENVNVQAIDTQMKKNENHTVGDATELVSGTVHALTRLTPDTPMLRFTATSKFTAGDTFTVDGVQVSALTVSGEQLPDGAYVIGSEVLAYLKGTLLTFFTSQGTLATAQNALKLGGNAPEYYASATAVQQAQDTATAAGNLANEVNSNLSKNTFTLYKYSNGTNTITLPSDYRELIILLSARNNENKVISYSLHLLKIMLSSEYRYFPLGGYWTDNNAYGCYIAINDSSINLLSNRIGNTDVASTTDIFVYLNY